MPRQRDYVPHGVIPAVRLPFYEKGLSAVTTNAHASEVASCTFDEQRRA
jgi:4-hydroxy-tetrahydrodipicolinate synthase